MSYPPPPPPGYGQQPGFGQQPGYPPPPAAGFGGYGAPVQNQSNGLAIAALICGIVGFLTCGVTGLVAIPLGFAGLSKAKKLNGTGKGLAIGGLVTGLLSVVATVAFLVLVVWAADKVDDIDFRCGSDGISSQGHPCRNLGDRDPDPSSYVDPSDNICNVDRYFEDPDC